MNKAVDNLCPTLCVSLVEDLSTFGPQPINANSQLIKSDNSFINKEKLTLTHGI
jgi:hypothetical protein